MEQKPISRRNFFKLSGAALAVAAVPNISLAGDNQIYIPGLEESVELSDKIIPGGNFNWKEATHNGERIPEQAYQTQNILEAAKRMEVVREFFGDRPIRVNSWYRDPKTNAMVGGASKSRHLEGDAVDFTVKGVSPHEVYSSLDSTWGKTGGLGKYNTFTHIDLRGKRARWKG
jgi:uncharacterized protein YcbK (DUF882 family)